MIQQEIQKLSADSLVTLLEIDTTTVIGAGGAIHRFVEAKDPNTNTVEFNGEEYTPLPFKLSGFEKTSSGPIPQPSLIIADIAGTIVGYLQSASNGDLVGSRVTRILTFKQYLTTNNDERFPDEVYYIERKASASQFQTTFTLSSPFDLQGLKLPKRLVLKDTCTLIYRTYSVASDTFTTYENQCPYGTSPLHTNMFKITGESTVVKAEDNCGKRYSDCVLRFPKPEVLPMNSFPGASELRK